MNETSKSTSRRSHDLAFLQHYFVGEGLDIGADEDPLSAHRHVFPGVKRITSWGREQGDMVNMIVGTTPARGHQRAQNAAGWPNDCVDLLRRAIARSPGQ